MRVFKNHDPSGVPYLSEQALRVHDSLWNGESWATRSGAGRLRQDQLGLPAECNLDQIG
uniref:Xyloglucan endotransglucosylase/hydrolase n=1 Tax=Saccharum officinarum TaxID=4547 RepID=A0A678T565_SACOF|nr:Xyloglucan endotransglucosylase/hydrolase [Saccharum officinarum]